MMSGRRLVWALLFVTQTAFAGEPLYVLRAEYVPGTEPGWQQGIIRFDPETRAESPFASFNHTGGLIGPWGGLQLAAVADRIIAQGAAYYEFEAFSGQFLRRYAAMAPPFDTWAFHGAAVDPATAEELGISPGYYGSVNCPPGGDPVGELCNLPDVPFPGYTSSRTSRSEQHVFLRRGFDPGDTSLSVVKLFSPQATGDTIRGTRWPGLDLKRRQFWFWLQGSNGSEALRRLSSAPILAGTVGDESFLREDRWRATDPETDRMRSAQAFAFDAARDSFFFAFAYTRSYDKSLIHQTIEGDEQILKYVGDPRSYNVSGIVPLPEIEPELHTQLLPAVAEAAGANGTYWRSDAWFFNPSDAPMELTLRRVSKPDDLEQRHTIAAKASLKITSILRELGGGVSGDGITTDAVIIESSYRAGAQLSAWSRTYTPSPSGGTYGQAIPAVPSLVGWSNHIALTTGTGSMAQTQSVFILDKRNPRQFRHNLGVVNTSDAPITLGLRYASDSWLPMNDPDREKFLVVAPHSVRQVSIEALFPREVVEEMPPRISVNGDRPAALWLSMVDNLTGDASFIPFTQYGIGAAPGERLAFPSVAYTPGANGTFWRTDAYGLFSNGKLGQTQSPEAIFYPASGECSTAGLPLNLVPSAGATELVPWHPWWYTTFADLARQACFMTEGVTGALEVDTGSWTSAFSRTYTKREDGGTYGDILPLYPPRGWPSRHFAGVEINEAVRVNLGFYNGSDTPSSAELRLYENDGTLAATRVLDLAPRGSLQLPVRQMFEAELADGLYALSVVTLEGAGSWPYVSTVDNITGDPTNWW